jgi:hypothetical protein
MCSEGWQARISFRKCIGPGAIPGPFSFDALFLDSHAEFGCLFFIAGVRKEVTRGAPVELVAHTQFPANVEPEGNNANGCRCPSDGAKRYPRLITLKFQARQNTHKTFPFAAPRYAIMIAQFGA